MTSIVEKESVHTDEGASKHDNQSLAVSTSGLSKSFGRTRVLRDVDLEVRQGETLALFGPNGAGKTTLLRILATLSQPTAGQVRIAGLDAQRQAGAIRRKIGVVMHNTFLYNDLTVEENLAFYARMYRVPDQGDSQSVEKRIVEVLTLVGMHARRHQVVRTLSRGMQQRVSLARAVLHRPAALIWDEPDTGLDRGGEELLRDLLQCPVGGRRAAVIATHDIGLGLALADRVAILANGRIVYQCSRTDLNSADFPDLYDLSVRKRS
jgi:heme exporter protein A